MSETDTPDGAVFSDALIMLKAHHKASVDTTTVPRPSSWFLVPRLSPCYYKMLVTGVDVSKIEFFTDVSVTEAFARAKRGTVLAIIRKCDLIKGASQKPPRLVTRVDQGGSISREDVRTICERSQRKNYLVCDITSIFIDRDWECCSH